MTLTDVWNWTKKTAVASFVPCVAVAITVCSIVCGLFYLVLFVLTFGFYLLAAAIVIPICLLLMRLGGWKIQWREWLVGK